VKEVASVAGISAAAADKRLQRALAKLRDRLSARGLSLGVPAIAATLLFGSSQKSLALAATSQGWAEHAFLASEKFPLFCQV
jgi:fermentation-respiration switch protein FrsA (DUF1100 family)